MRTLDQLLNSDKGTLLFELFRPEIPGFVDYMESMAQRVIDEQDILHENWNNGLLDLHEWVYLAGEIRDLLAKEKKRIAGNKAWFVLHLFNGFYMLFTCHCLEHYTRRQECPAKLALAIHTLFDTDYRYVPVPKILITVWEGVITDIHTNMRHCKTLTVDFDQRENGVSPVGTVQDQEAGFEDGKAYLLFAADGMPESEVLDDLKRIKY